MRGATGEAGSGGSAPGPTNGGAAEVRRGLYARLFAWLLAQGEPADRRIYGPHKRRLLSALRGTVVEIGPGAGVNLPYLDASVRWVGVEPNVHFHEGLRQRAAEAGVEAEVVGGRAERLPLPDASADAVVSTLVLCSVADLAGALAEVQRVLRPGGAFVFVEHVAAPEGTALRRVQRLLRRPWGLLADGCRSDRETGRAIEAAGFEEVRIERFRARLPIPLIRPHVLGTARKAA